MSKQTSPLNLWTNLSGVVLAIRWGSGEVWSSTDVTRHQKFDTVSQSRQEDEEAMMSQENVQLVRGMYHRIETVKPRRFSSMPIQTR